MNVKGEEREALGVGCCVYDHGIWEIRRMDNIFEAPQQDAYTTGHGSSPVIFY